MALDKTDGETMTSLPPEFISREFLFVLPALNRLIGRDLRGENGDDTTLVQIRVLAFLIDAPITMSALARKRRVSLQAASELVQGIVARGWVVREPDPKDRRQSLLHITDEGRRQFALSQEQMVKTLLPLIETLSEDERDSVHYALIALRRVLSTQDPLIIPEGISVEE
jgi:DNA-binding MarR family transcriptional regulator